MTPHQTFFGSIALLWADIIALALHAGQPEAVVYGALALSAAGLMLASINQLAPK